MTKEQALKFLNDVAESEASWRPNKGLTISQAKKIMIKGITEMKRGTVLDKLTVKRVYQVVRNRCRPDTEREL